MSLTCEEFRELLADHLDGELVDKKESFEVHRTTCENCGYYLESYTYTVKVVKKLPKCGPLPAPLEAKLRDTLKDHLRDGKA